MITKNVESSQISSIGYDEKSKVFEVVYKTGGKYEYYDVSADLWIKAQEAQSVGKFVHAYIKPHKYKKIS